MVDDCISHECPVGAGGGEVQVGLEPGEVDSSVSCWDVNEANTALFFRGIEFINANCRGSC